MQTHPITTPFGRRPASLGQLAAQVAVREALREAAAPGSNAPAAVNKWQLFRTLTEIRGKLGLSDRSLALLNALLTFHPETALTLPRPEDEGEGVYGPCGLVVFPSNRQLSLAPTAWPRRRCATIWQRSSLPGSSPGATAPMASATPAGRARRPIGPADAFGFDLTPLVARATEFEAMAEAGRRERRRLQLLRNGSACSAATPRS